MRTGINNVRFALPALLAVGAISIGVAGCGGGGYSSAASGTSSTSGGQRSVSAPSVAAIAGIPRHNGGDHDSDNNGGPSDGDGNV